VTITFGFFGALHTVETSEIVEYKTATATVDLSGCTVECVGPSEDPYCCAHHVECELICSDVEVTIEYEDDEMQYELCVCKRQIYLQSAWSVQKCATVDVDGGAPTFPSGIWALKCDTGDTDETCATPGSTS